MTKVQPVLMTAITYHFRMSAKIVIKVISLLHNVEREVASSLNISVESRVSVLSPYRTLIYKCIYLSIQ